MDQHTTESDKARPVATLKDYEKFVEKEAIDEIRAFGDRLRGKKVVHINSTKVGGGVAEILQKLIPLLEEVGVNAEWQTIGGDLEFYETTKDIHNALHGKKVHLTKDMLDHYLRINEENARKMESLVDADFVVVHDPQPAALIQYFPKRRGKWIWRCHIDVSTPDHYAWEFLKTYAVQYDAVVFHSDRFAKKDLLVRQFIVPPSIDPLSPKNRPMGEEEVDGILQGHHISRRKPIVSQIGRFDRLKDPRGVVKTFLQVKRSEGVVDVDRFFRGEGYLDVTRIWRRGVDCQLVLAGGLAKDDPEGEEVYRSVLKQAGGDKDIHVLKLPPFADLDINAIQRASSVVLQKSLKEGFALTVSEGLWKATPVVGGNTGGIPLQIVDGVNGFLVNNVEQAAERVRFLLNHPEKAREMGEAGREHVKKYFLITRHVRDHLLMYLTVDLMTKLVQL